MTMPILLPISPSSFHFCPFCLLWIFCVSSPSTKKPLVISHTRINLTMQNVIKYLKRQFKSLLWRNMWHEIFLAAVTEVLNQLSPSLRLYKFTHRPLKLQNMEQPASEERITDFICLLERTRPAEWTLANADGFEGKLLYIYTSGTTGLPKAAVISNARYIDLE